jgi:hypothetical protein
MDDMWYFFLSDKTGPGQGFRIDEGNVIDFISFD